MGRGPGGGGREEATQDLGGDSKDFGYLSKCSEKPLEGWHDPICIFKDYSQAMCGEWIGGHRGPGRRVRELLQESRQEVALA